MDDPDAAMLNRVLDEAIAQHNAGDLAKAESGYRQILQARPDNPDVTHLLGLLSLQTGRTAQAISLFQRAIALNPGESSFHCNLGSALTLSGNPQQAIHTYQNALKLEPNLAAAYNGLGNAMNSVHRSNDAILAFRTALSLRPDYAEALFNLGNALRSQKQWDEAIVVDQRLLVLGFRVPEVYCRMAMALHAKGNLREAITALQNATSLKPDYAEAHGNLADLLREAEQLGPAIEEYRKAVACDPQNSAMHYNLGSALFIAGQAEQAITALQQTLRLKPDMAEAHNNLGAALYECGRFTESLSEYHQAVKLCPDNQAFHFNLGINMLLLGQFEQGWMEHENRPQLQKPMDGAQPRWDGSPLNGRSILVKCEQGFGDTIQFARYLPLLARRGAAKIIFECPPELSNLVWSVGDVQIVVRGSVQSEFDVHVSLMSLPHLLDTRAATIPGQPMPYIQADPARTERWRSRVADESRLKVGLAWAGSPRHQNDRNRSITLSALAPLAQATNVRFFSLQKGEAAGQSKQPPVGLSLTDWTDELIDFCDTAALVENLDLVVTADTAIAHLAGALGKPVWVLIPFVPDWRWMLDRSDSPWYPTMQLFRQKQLREWTEAIENIVNALTSTPPQK